MDIRSRNTPVTPGALLVRLVLAALILAWMAPAAVDAAPAPPAAVVAQTPSPCGDKPCPEQPPAGISACGDHPCPEGVPEGVSACGDKPCGEVPPGVSACGDKPCGEVPPGVSACGDRPCGEPGSVDVNQPPPAADAPPGDVPADPPPGATTDSTTPGQEGFREGEAARPFDGENASSSSSWILPVLFVALAALALFWVVRRNRASADSEL